MKKAKHHKFRRSKFVGSQGYIKKLQPEKIVGKHKGHDRHKSYINGRNGKRELPQREQVKLQNIFDTMAIKIAC